MKNITPVVIFLVTSSVSKTNCETSLAIKTTFKSIRRGFGYYS